MQIDIEEQGRQLINALGRDFLGSTKDDPEGLIRSRRSGPTSFNGGPHRHRRVHRHNNQDAKAGEANQGAKQLITKAQNCGPSDCYGLKAAPK